MYQREWLDVITELYPELHLDERVIHHSNNNDKKNQKVLSWLEKIEEIHNIVAERKDKHLEQLYKEMYYNLYIIKEEDIPNSYYQNEIKQRGYENITLTDNIKHLMAMLVIEIQKASLDKWIEYFLYDEELKNYPIWKKYWVFQGLQMLGKYDKEINKFSKRDKTTISPFPPVEREAIFTTLNFMEQYLKDKTTSEEIKNTLEKYNFKELYEYSLKQVPLIIEHKNLNVEDEKLNVEHKNESEGIWIKYEIGSDYLKLSNSLSEYYTGWDVAREVFARSRLEKGDIYIYYTKDEKNEYKIPRIIIRMKWDNRIAEIRGIADNKNIEPEMLPILNKKLEEFPDKKQYLKKIHDMNYLTNIDIKVQNNQKLSIEELRFLYEIDDKIEGFGFFAKDPRKEKIKQKRNIKEDLAIIFNCQEDEIGLSFQNNNYQGFKIWYGDIIIETEAVVELLKIKYHNEFPEILLGNLKIEDLDSINSKKIKFPKLISGTLSMGKIRIRSLEGFKLPEIVNGDLNLESLESAKGLKLPETVNGDLNLRSLRSAEGLKLPGIVNGDLSLGLLRSAEGLKLPETVNGMLDLRSLESAEGLKLPKIVNGNLSLWSLKSAEGLKLPEIVNGGLDFGLLESAEGLKLPEIINGDLRLGSLETTKELILPEIIDGSLVLNSLRTIDNLKFPKIINGDLIMLCLEEAKNMNFPNIVRGQVILSSLKFAQNIKFPEIITDDLNLMSLEIAEKLIFPKLIKRFLNVSSLDVIKDLDCKKTTIGSQIYIQSDNVIITQEELQEKLEKYKNNIKVDYENKSDELEKYMNNIKIKLKSR